MNDSPTSENPTTSLPIEETPPLTDLSQTSAPTTPNPELRTQNSEPLTSGNTQTPSPSTTNYQPPTINQSAISRRFPFKDLIVNTILFAILFIAGIGISMLLRQLFIKPSESPSDQEVSLSTPPPLLPESEQKTADWETYQITSGVTKAPVSGITFRLPQEVLRPICDTSGCASQGSYLPGGSRFTVAARGAGQLLSDYRIGTLSDLSGRAFTVSDATVAGTLARDFRGDFTGTTNGGYSFSRMHGVMLPLTDTLSVEFNHFAPSGLAVDFTADEVLFADILSTIKIDQPVATSSPTPAASPSAASTL